MRTSENMLGRNNHPEIPVVETLIFWTLCVTPFCYLWDMFGLNWAVSIFFHGWILIKNAYFLQLRVKPPPQKKSIQENRTAHEKLLTWHKHRLLSFFPLQTKVFNNFLVSSTEKNKMSPVDRLFCWKKKFNKTLPPLLPSIYIITCDMWTAHEKNSSVTSNEIFSSSHYHCESNQRNVSFSTFTRKYFWKGVSVTK